MKYENIWGVFVYDADDRVLKLVVLTSLIRKSHSLNILQILYCNTTGMVTFIKNQRPNFKNPLLRIRTKK